MKWRFSLSYPFVFLRCFFSFRNALNDCSEIIRSADKGTIYESVLNDRIGLNVMAEGFVSISVAHLPCKMQR